jgi:hypothetical protein
MQEEFVPVSPEQKDWARHRSVLRAVDRKFVGCRGCFGIALVTDVTTQDSWVKAGHRLFASNDDVCWATMVDIPEGRFAGIRREVHWASVRRAKMPFGVVSLCHEERGWDFRSAPEEKGERSRGVLSPTAHPQLFRVFNKVEWAMTSTAFAFRRPWKPLRPVFHAAMGKTSLGSKDLLLFGPGEMGEVERPRAWMPRPYFGFPDSWVDDLYDRVTRPHGDPEGPASYPPTLSEAFVVSLNAPYTARYAGAVKSVDVETYHGFECLVFTLAAHEGGEEVVRFNKQHAIIKKAAGEPFLEDEVIAEENYKLPGNWDNVPSEKRWERLFPNLVGAEHRDAAMRVWFERQFYFLDQDHFYVAAALAAPAAAVAPDSLLRWDVGRSMPYFDESCDAFVFPTIATSHWDVLSGILPGNVAYDFFPKDPRFNAGPSWRRGRKSSKKRQPAPTRAEMVEQLGGVVGEDAGVPEEEPQAYNDVDVPDAAGEPQEEEPQTAQPDAAGEPQPFSDQDAPDAPDAPDGQVDDSRIFRLVLTCRPKLDKLIGERDGVPVTYSAAGARVLGPKGGKTRLTDKRFKKGAVVLAMRSEFDPGLDEVRLT